MSTEKKTSFVLNRKIIASSENAKYVNLLFTRFKKMVATLIFISLKIIRF